MTPRTIADVLVPLVLAAIGLIGFAAAFDSSAYALAGAGGLVVGSAAAVVAARLRLGILPTAGLVVAAYFLLGTPFVAPADGILVVLPSIASLAALAIGAVYGWADILTLQAPLSLPDYVTAVPYAAALLVAFTSATLALRWLPRRRSAPRAAVLLIGPAALYAVGVLLGTDEPVLAVARGAAFAGIALVWLGWRRRATGSTSSAAAQQLLRRKLVGTAIVVVAAIGLGAAAAAVLAPQPDNRFVLRDEIEPPFEPLEYPSPLAGFREYTKDLVDTELMVVEGLQPGDRIRMTAMDVYDGVTWNVAGASEALEGSGRFRLVGRTIPEPPLASTSAAEPVTVDIVGYADVWLPSAGYAADIAFLDGADEGEGTPERVDVRYNAATGAALVTSGASEGLRYRVATERQVVPEDDALLDAPVAAFAPAPVVGVPDTVVALAAELTATAESPVEKLRALEQHLATTGYYSRGTASDQVPSRAGHAADRMNDMVTLPSMVGDEEQYASLFALMARSLDYPTRVVMGFAPEVGEGGGPVAVTGDDVTAWVEVAFDGVGWVPFFPIPDETDVPQDQIPEPRTEPQPQVRQPPRTDSEQDDLVTAVEIDDTDDEERDDPVVPGWLLGAMLALGIPLMLVLVPMLVIALLKRRRAERRRRAAEGHRAVAGAWDELVDRFSELGADIPQRTTRVHVAAGLAAGAGSRDPGADDARGGDDPRGADGAPLRALALRTDEAVFSGREIDAREAEEVWAEALAAAAAAHERAGRSARFRSRFRLASARAAGRRLVARAQTGSPPHRPPAPPAVD